MLVGVEEAPNFFGNHHLIAPHWSRRLGLGGPADKCVAHFWAPPPQPPPPREVPEHDCLPRCICLGIGSGTSHHFCVPKLGLLVFSALLLSSPLHGVSPLPEPLECFVSSAEAGQRLSVTRGNEESAPAICRVCQAQSSR